MFYTHDVDISRYMWIYKNERRIVSILPLKLFREEILINPVEEIIFPKATPELHPENYLPNAVSFQQ